MIDTLIIGAIRGAIQEVVPKAVLPQMRETVIAAHQTPPSQPLPAGIAPVIDTAAIAEEVLRRIMDVPGIDKLREVEEPKPWYASKGIWGGVVAFLTPVAGVIGWSLTEVDSQDLIAVMMGVASAIGGVMAIIGRARATSPVKATK